MSGAVPPGEAAGHRLEAGERFYLGHGLGNDYLVFEAATSNEPGRWALTPGTVQLVCRRGSGVGSDGLILLMDRSTARGPYEIRGFNPDGSEFERSGNGLRVLASFLAREGVVSEHPFEVRTGGCVLRLQVHRRDRGGEYDVSVGMGVVRVGLEYLQADPRALDADGRALHPRLGPVEFVPVSVGNPHAVVFPSEGSPASVKEIGPFLSTHPAFPEGANVQLVEVMGPQRMRIAVWERGAGRTSASGTSACASVAASVATGRLEPGTVLVEMEGGVLEVSVTGELEVTLRGLVHDVAEGRLSEGFRNALAASP